MCACLALPPPKMVEIIVLSDDEDSYHSAHGTRVLETSASTPNLQHALGNDRKRNFKLVLVDSRQCPRMPRPRFLPVRLSHEALPEVAQVHSRQIQGNSDRRDKDAAAEAVGAAGSAAEIDDEEADPDYEDVRPAKRHRAGVNKMPKKHGKLTAPDWEVVRNGKSGHGNLKRKYMLPAGAAYDRKEAKDYVKRLTANMDWEDIFRHLGMLRVTAERTGRGGTNQEIINDKPRRGSSQANQVKQYLQNALTNSVVRMNLDARNEDIGAANTGVSSKDVHPGRSQPRKVPPSSSPPPSSKSSASPPSK